MSGTFFAADLAGMLAKPRGVRAYTAVTPSAAAASDRAGDVLRGGDVAARRRGDVMHAWFERVGWVGENPLPDDAELLALADGLPDADTLLAEFHAALASADVADALRRPHDDVELWRERPFALRLGDRLAQGRFDRVHVISDTPGSAALIDFKTDRIADTDAALAAANNHHRPQIDLYRRVLAKLLRLDRDAIQAKLIYTAGGRVVEL